MLSIFLVRNLNLNFVTYSILLTFAFYLFFISLKDFFVKKITNVSQNIAHFGFSLFILSILFNNIYSTEIITNLKIGETFEGEKLKINFASIERKKEQNFDALIGKFKIESNDGEIEILYPELRIYNQPNIVTSEAYIKTNFIEDKFITMNSVNNQEYFNIRYQIKPYMLWIWISVLLISLGGATSFFKKKYEK